MTDTFFEILRAGINTTMQDTGRNHLYHIGITVSGAIDQRNYKLANLLTDNKLNETVIEFAYQGPLMRLNNGKINFAITGDVFFNIIRNNSVIEEGKCYQNYILNDGEQIDIISSKKSPQTLVSGTMSSIVSVISLILSRARFVIPVCLSLSSKPNKNHRSLYCFK